MKSRQSSWFVIPSPISSPRARLFCLPYAGGSAAIYRDWIKALDKDIELVIIQAPGRESRLFEEPYKVIHELVNELVIEMLPLVDRPYSIFGHSLGGRIALELMNELAIKKCRMPDVFIASGSRAPHLPLRKPSIADLPYEDFIEALREMGGTPPEVLDNHELMELFLPMLRADFAMASEITKIPSSVFDCHVAIFWGTEDVHVPEQDVKPWADFFVGKTTLQAFDGGHFFIDTQRDFVIKQVNNLLTGYY